MRSMYIYDLGENPHPFPSRPQNWKEGNARRNSFFGGLAPLGQLAQKTKFQVGRLDPMLLLMGSGAGTMTDKYLILFIDTMQQQL